MNNDACVIGYGMVGQATAKALKINHYLDINPEKSNIKFADLIRFKYLFLCLPTPVKENKKYETSHIENLISRIKLLNPNAILIIRSTVYPGFAKKMQQKFLTNSIISNPEFLSEKTAIRDTKFPPFILLGGANKRILNSVSKFILQFIKAPVILTDNTTAELSKIALNSYFSTKVIFANQIYDIAQNLGADYEKVKKVLESHPFGPNNHFTIWYNGKRGIHGNCLPKDSTAFFGVSKSPLIKKILELNKKYVDLKKE